MMLKLGFEYETIEDLLLLFDQKSTLKKKIRSLFDIVTAARFFPLSGK